MKILLKPTGDELMEAHVDITEPQIVEIVVRDDKKVVWVNVDGVCVCRICRIPHLEMPEGA